MPSPSANGNDAALSFDALVAAHFDCRKHKRNTEAALRFEVNLERNLAELYERLASGAYQPGRSICFVDTDHGKPREIWAAEYRDRVVHHLLYNRIAARFERSFVADSCACMRGRGTLYAAQRLERHVRSCTENWTRRAFYLQCDLQNFFVSIEKPILFALLAGRVSEPWWRELTATILFHDPRADAEVQCSAAKLAMIPAYKSLWRQPAQRGLPIGNLSSQFFANVYLDVLDQHVKHRIGAPYYVRYVDDFVLLHESPRWLNEAKAEIEEVLAVALRLRLNAAKTILQPISRGIDFVGQVIAPHHRTIRRRTFRKALHRLARVPADGFARSANSYFGLLRQATRSHGDRAQLANIARRRGHAVDAALTKVYG